MKSKNNNKRNTIQWIAFEIVMLSLIWNGNQANSDPPQRGIEKVDVISK